MQRVGLRRAGGLRALALGVLWALAGGCVTDGAGGAAVQLGVAPAVASEAPAEDGALRDDRGLVLEVPDRLVNPPLSRVPALAPEADLLSRAHLQDGRYVVGRGEAVAELTLDARLQQELQRVLQRAGTQYAAAVALEPATGRVLAIAEYSSARPDLKGLALRAVFPAASVFKVITAAALLQTGVSPEDGVCSHGGAHLITREQLLDGPEDHDCFTLTSALARSANAAFAKLTFKYLSAELLRQRAEAFGFNRPLSFPIPTDVSPAAFEGGPVMVAATGAGFGRVFLSPLHGAVIAATAANGGVWRPPVLFEHQVERAASQERTVMSPHEARLLAGMMQATVLQGTARGTFGPDGPLLEAAGKTGTLSDVEARQYSWFIGFAPREQPRIAVAAVSVNPFGKKVPAAWFAREAMRIYLRGEGPLLNLQFDEGE